MSGQRSIEPFSGPAGGTGSKQKKPGGNQMSQNKRRGRRLSLLAGSSLVVSLSVFAGAGLAPTRALAANECGDPSANGPAADTLVCPPGTYPTGIDYSTTSNGDLTVVLRNRVDTGTSDTAGTGPVVMTGKAGEDMSLIREDTVGGGDPRIVNTAGAGRAIDVSTLGDGNVLVNLTDGDPTAGEASTVAPMVITGSTDGIRANAQGTGNVNVTIASTGTQSGTNHVKSTIRAGSGGSGIVARTTSGAINVDASGVNFTNSVPASGNGMIDAQSTTGNIAVTTGTGFANFSRLFGVRAQTGGAGSVSVTTNSNMVASAGAAIDVATQSGQITVNAASEIFGTSSGPVGGIRAISTGGGPIVVNTRGLSFGSTDRALSAVTSGGNGSVTITADGNISGRLIGIYAETAGTGALTITARGSVQAGNLAGAAAIQARSGTGLLRIDLDNSTGSTQQVTATT
ncbi:MAG TPA: hypothetical protein VFX95_06025, partial [Caulobacteraceae bacterium]|nr:hypothetical protein [Caulobacteraceae bacterium]